MLTLLPDHYQHFLNEGWTAQEIKLARQCGVRSVTREEAKELLRYTPPSGGIWFPFSRSWGQLRPDSRLYPDGHEAPKYCSPRGNIGPHALWIPPGHALGDLAAVTEGWKDAFLGTVRGGKPVGAIAGVSHVRKVLPKSSSIPLIFDSDGWNNANVMQALIKGGLHLNSKIALVPREVGEKAGLTEYFNAGKTYLHFKTLLVQAHSPEALLTQWLDYLSESPLPKHCGTPGDLYKKILKLADEISFNHQEDQNVA